MDEARAQEEINKYRKFRKVDGATYRKVNQFLRKRTYITAREWALARLCTDFRTTNGAEMTFIGEHLPELVPFMEEKYSPQAVNQARHSFKKKVRKSSATFFYGAMCGFFTTEELDDLLFEASEVARFLLEVESTTLDIDEEIDIEDRITGVMRSVGEAAKTILRTRVTDADREAGGPSAAGPGAGTADQPAGKPARRRRKKAAPVPETNGEARKDMEAADALPQAVPEPQPEDRIPPAADSTPPDPAPPVPQEEAGTGNGNPADGGAGQEPPAEGTGAAPAQQGADAE